MSIDSLNRNTLRITGMASGMDTDEIIKGMLLREKSKIDKIFQDKQIFEWKQEAYRDNISKIDAFRRKYLDVLSSDYILSENKFSSFETSTTDTSGAVSIKASTNANTGDYKVKVEKTAKAAMFTGNKLINSEKAGDLAFPIVIDNNNNELTVGANPPITLTNKTYNNLSELSSEINTKMEEANIKNVKAVVKDGTIKFSNKVNIDDDHNKLNVEIEGKKYTVDVENGYYTLEELASKINTSLSGKKSDDGSTTFPGYTAEADADGLNLVFKKEGEADVNDKVTFSGGTDSGNIVKFDARVNLSSEYTADGDYSKPSIAVDSLSYDKRIISGVNDSMTINIRKADGTFENVNIILDSTAIGSDVALSDIVTDINNKLKNPVQFNGTDVYTDDTNYQLKAEASPDGKLIFKSSISNDINITGTANKTLGMSDTFNIEQSGSDKMSDLIQGQQTFTINGHTFKYDFGAEEDSGDFVGSKNKTFDEILNEIGNEAKVDISYSSLSKKFVISTKETGSSQVINASDASGGSFISTLFGGDISNVKGEDAKVTITEPSGESNTVYKSSNDFTIDGIEYTISDTTTSDITFKVSSNVDNTFEKMKSFIDDYNGLIANINNKIQEKKQYSIKPLTEAQKEDMSEGEIKKWEDKAKQGILSNDSTLEKLLSQMRSAFFEKVEGAGVNLSEIGLSTSPDISQRGKIVIDEGKFKTALKEKPDEIKKLFIQQSPTQPYYSRNASSVERSERYDDSGIFWRISDIINDNVSTFRDTNGKKGMLLEMAGIKGDASETKNILSDRVKDKANQIKELNKKMYEKEDRYYQQFARLETMMNKLNAQQSWFASQMGSQ